MTMLIVTNRGLVSEDWLDITEQRDSLLVEADSLVNKAMDNNIDVTPFRQYRQALRDIPQTFSDAQDVVWPTKPQLSQS